MTDILEGLDLKGFIGNRAILRELLLKCTTQKQKEELIARARKYWSKTRDAWGYKFGQGNRGVADIVGIGRKTDFREDCLFGANAIASVLGEKPWTIKKLVLDGIVLPNYGRVPALQGALESTRKGKSGGTLFIHKRYVLLLFRLIRDRYKLRKSRVIEMLGSIFNWAEENKVELWGLE